MTTKYLTPKSSYKYNSWRKSDLSPYEFAMLVNIYICQRIDKMDPTTWELAEKSDIAFNSAAPIIRRLKQKGYLDFEKKVGDNGKYMNRYTVKNLFFLVDI